MSSFGIISHSPPSRLLRIAAALCALVGAAPASADAISRIAETGVLRLGHRADAPPFSYLEDGEPRGLAVRLCAETAPEIARAAGIAPEELRIEWKAVTAATRFGALVDELVDLHCGPATQTLSRREYVDFSILYYVDKAKMVFRKGGPERIGELTDDKVGVLRGTTTEKIARRELERRAPRAELVLFESHVDGLTALQNGDIEAYMGDKSILTYQLGILQPNLPPVMSRLSFSREPYALVMKRGESGLRLAVDRALSRLYASERLSRIVEESLGRAEDDPEVRAIYEVVALPD